MNKYIVLTVIGLLLVIGSSPCLADTGASIQLETNVINNSGSGGGIFIPSYTNPTDYIDYSYKPLPPAAPVIPEVPPVVIPPKVIPPIITTPSESITPVQPLPIQPTEPFPLIYILIGLLGIVGITLFILGLRKRNET